MSANDFVLQYAVRLPNGSLYCKPKPVSSYTSWVTLFGDFSQQAQQRELAVFDDRADAEKLLGEMRDAAAEVGVDNLGATIVTRLCSPFLADHDDGADFVAHITEWVEGQK